MHLQQSFSQESDEADFPAPASLSHSLHSIIFHYQKHIYFSSKCFQHQYAFKPYYFSNQGLKTACTKLFPLFPSANHCLSWLSHVFPGYGPSCSCKTRSKHVFLHGMFIIIFRIILLVHVLSACPRRAVFSRICTKLLDWLQASL